jgi:hypothetical protein
LFAEVFITCTNVEGTRRHVHHAIRVDTFPLWTVENTYELAAFLTATRGSSNCCEEEQKQE